MACYLFGAKPLSEPMLPYCQLDPKEHQLIGAKWCIFVSVQHTNIASDNGLLPVRRQAIIWTHAAILSIRP